MSSSSSVRLARPVSGSLSTWSSLSRQEARWARLAASTNAAWMPAQTQGSCWAAVAEDLVRVERAEDAVVERDDDQRDAVRHPVLVQRDDADHHEEDEVRLGDAAPQVHEGDRGGHEARTSSRRRGPCVPATGAPRARRARRRRPGRRRRRAGRRPAARRRAPAGRRRRQAEPHDRAVPALPDGLGQQAALGQQPGAGPGSGVRGSRLSRSAVPAPGWRPASGTAPSGGRSAQVEPRQRGLVADLGRRDAGMPSSVGWPRTGPLCEWSMWLRGVTSSRSRAASAVSP